MDLSWPLPPAASINGVTPKDTYLGMPQKMHLASTQDLAQLIHQARKGAHLYCCDISCAYHQLPLDLVDWPY